MNAIKEFVVVTLLLMIGVATVLSQNIQSYEMSPSNYETVIGTISGERDAGESYDIYYYKESLIRELSRWEYMEWRDRRVSYSKEQLYEMCLSEAKRRYGSSYPGFYLRNFRYESREQELPNFEYYSQVIGSGEKYKKTDRKKRVYIYSATVVVTQ